MSTADSARPGPAASGAGTNWERVEQLFHDAMELPAEQRDDGDQGGRDEQRGRPQPEDPEDPGSGHAFAAALCFFTAFFTMKRSICSRASSSRICFGGDFMR